MVTKAADCASGLISPARGETLSQRGTELRSTVQAAFALSVPPMCMRSATDCSSLTPVLVSVSTTCAIRAPDSRSSTVMSDGWRGVAQPYPGRYGARLALGAPRAGVVGGRHAHDGLVTRAAARDSLVLALSLQVERRSPSKYGSALGDMLRRPARASSRTISSSLHLESSSHMPAALPQVSSRSPLPSVTSSIWAAVRGSAHPSTTTARKAYSFTTGSACPAGCAKTKSPPKPSTGNERCRPAGGAGAAALRWTGPSVTMACTSALPHEIWISSPTEMNTPPRWTKTAEAPSLVAECIVLFRKVEWNSSSVPR
mmetsp:Transcript_11609/g.38280  ORF Transcript_11609/g.38280 Transcript_11609/m.38280 type:complete len:314 (+) Transcript_11609:2304-3245(+)